MDQQLSTKAPYRVAALLPAGWIHVMKGTHSMLRCVWKKEWPLWLSSYVPLFKFSGMFLFDDLLDTVALVGWSLWYALKQCNVPEKVILADSLRGNLGRAAGQRRHLTAQWLDSRHCIDHAVSRFTQLSEKWYVQHILESFSQSMGGVPDSH